MKTETINGIEITIGDKLRWREPETQTVHEGWATPYGHPFAGYCYVLVSQTHPIMSVAELATKLDVEKIGNVLPNDKLSGGEKATDQRS